MTKVLRRAALLLGLLLALATLRLVLGRLAGPMLVGDARARFETELGPMRPELADQTLPPEDNAGLLLLEAVATLDLSETDRELFQRIGRDPSAVEDLELRRRVRTVVERNREPLALVDRATERPESLLKKRREYFLGGDEQGTLFGLLDVAKLIRAEGWSAIAEGDDARLLVSVERLATLTRALRQERVVVAALVSFPIEGFLQDLVRRRVADPVPAGAIARLDRALATIEAAPGIRDTLATEFSVGDAVYLELRAAAGEEEPGWKELFRLWDENHVRAEGILAYAELGSLIDRPRAEWPEPAGRPRGDTLRALVDPFSGPTFAREILVPNLRDGIEKAQRNDAARALARASLGSFAGELPSDSDRVTYTGESIHTRTLEGGTLELSLPRAAALVQAEADDYPDLDDSRHHILRRQVERMTWRVAPPVESSPDETVADGS